jgi:hypothetical protein
LRRSDVGERVIERNLRADFATLRDIRLGVTERDVAPHAIEQRGRHDVISICSEAIRHATNMVVDTEDLLHDDDATPAGPRRQRLVRVEPVAVAGDETDHPPHVASLPRVLRFIKSRADMRLHASLASYRRDYATCEGSIRMRDGFGMHRGCVLRARRRDPQVHG